MLCFVGTPDGFLGSGSAGISDSGVLDQLIIQIKGIIIICTWTAIATLFTLKVISFVTDIRVSTEDEEIGLDMSEHNEQGYNL